jgi:LysR family transcriptional regulator, cyn operon transcriptional activator
MIDAKHGSPEMNFRHLRTFVAIAEAGGIHRAVARLNLSQPAASRQIHALEAELGVPLFDRIGRRVQLTSEGQDILRRSQRLLAEVQSLTERAGALKKGETGTLRVGATPQVIENTLSAFLVRYRHRHPGVEVQLAEEGGTDLPRRLDRGDLKFAIMAVDDERFEHRLLYPVYELAVMSAKHRLSRRNAIEVTELSDEPLMLLRGGFASRDWFETACRIAHLRPRVLLESAAPHTVMALAGDGYGVAIIPSTMRVPRGRIRAIPIIQRGAALGRWLRIAWDPQRFLAPYADQFVKELIADCRRAFPGQEFARRAPTLPRPKGLRIHDRE